MPAPSYSSPSDLPEHAARELDERGFTVITDLLTAAQVHELETEYERAFVEARPADLRVGSTSTKLNDLVNRGSAFDALYLFPALLQAAARVIGQPFKLSTLLARTLRPGTERQELHVDVRRGTPDWPLLGFIWMIDEFRPDNGGTLFLAGSHCRLEEPPSTPAAVEGLESAVGPPGALLVFHGSTWHGHGMNTSKAPRRSIQGAFIPRHGRAGTNFAAAMNASTRARLSPAAQELLSLDSSLHAV